MSYPRRGILRKSLKRMDNTLALFIASFFIVAAIIVFGILFPTSTDIMTQAIAEACEKSCLSISARGTDTTYTKISTIFHEKYVWSCRCTNGLHMVFDSDVSAGKYWFEDDAYNQAFQNGNYSPEVRKFIEAQSLNNRPSREVVNGRKNER
jgi:hypothetical protein